MPFTQPTPPFIEVQHVYSLPDGDCLNRFVFAAADGGTATQLNDWADDYYANIAPDWLQFLSEDVFMLGFFFKYRSTTDLFETQRGVGDAGAQAGEAIPAQDVIVIDWYFSAATGGTRLARGRTGISGITEAAVTNGHCDDFTRNQIATFATDLSTPAAFNGSTPSFCIWRPAYSTMAVVNAGRVNQQVRTNRHRRPSS